MVDIAWCITARKTAQKDNFVWKRENIKIYGVNWDLALVLCHLNISHRFTKWPYSICWRETNPTREFCFCAELSVTRRFAARHKIQKFAQPSYLEQSVVQIYNLLTQNIFFLRMRQCMNVNSKSSYGYWVVISNCHEAMSISGRSSSLFTQNKTFWALDGGGTRCDALTHYH